MGGETRYDDYLMNRPIEAEPPSLLKSCKWLMEQLRTGKLARVTDGGVYRLSTKEFINGMSEAAGAIARAEGR